MRIIIFFQTISSLKNMVHIKVLWCDWPTKLYKRSICDLIIFLLLEQHFKTPITSKSMWDWPKPLSSLYCPIQDLKYWARSQWVLSAFGWEAPTAWVNASCSYSMTRAKSTWYRLCLMKSMWSDSASIRWMPPKKTCAPLGN